MIQPPTTPLEKPSTTPQPTLSIVVACHNERDNIAPLLAQFVTAHQEMQFELLIVDDGSTDDTAQVTQEALAANHRYDFARLITYPKNKGYGGAIMTGLAEAKGDILAWTHADLQTDPRDVTTAYRAHQSQADQRVIVKGKRTNREFGPTLFTFVMSLIASFEFGKPLFDINAQPKLFDRAFYQKLTNPPSDFSLDLYLLVMANKLGYKIVTVPVHFAKRQHGESKWATTWQSKVKTIKRTIRYIFTLRNQLR